MAYGSSSLLVLLVERRSEGVGRGSVMRRHHVRVELQRDRNVGVAEPVA